MCLPLPIIAAGVAAAGSLYGGLAGMQQGKYEARVARQNAALETERAQDSVARGRLEARDFYRQVGQVKGQQVASMAANSIDLGFGSAVALQQDTAQGAQDDAENLYKNIHERTRGFDINASNFRTEAKAAKMRGKSALIGSVFQAGSSLMGGFQQQKAMRAKLGTPRAPTFGGSGVWAPRPGNWGR